MSRPRAHNQDTATALLEAAEHVAAEEGLGAVSVRRVAHEVGTTTRAVYSLFGSKDGLVTALGARAFDLLGAAVAALPRTTDPAADLVAAGLQFRDFAWRHPALFRVAVQRIGVPAETRRGFAAAANGALAVLHERIRPLEGAGRLGGRSIEDAAWEFHALCEGLAALEARCLVRDADADRMWESALAALVRGWGCEDSRRGASGSAGSPARD
jgi:AcrR family transcriptional regulator